MTSVKQILESKLIGRWISTYLCTDNGAHFHYVKQFREHIDPVSKIQVKSIVIYELDNMIIFNEGEKDQLIIGFEDTFNFIEP